MLCFRCVCLFVLFCCFLTNATRSLDPKDFFGLLDKNNFVNIEIYFTREQETDAYQRNECI